MKKKIFNSVGSNYTFGFALRTLFSVGGETERENLESYLSKRYIGETVLFYKGRQAIEYALRASNMPENSRVVICAYTCAVVPTAVKNAGYIPIYADISEESLDFNFETLKKLCDENVKIRAVIVQNTLGFTNSIKEIETLCHERNIILIEDLAHSVGATYPDGREVGTVGDYVVLSFSQDKVIDAVSGGALIIRRGRSKPEGLKFSTVSFREQLRDRLYPILSVKIRKTYSIGLGKALHGLLGKARLLSRPVYSLKEKGFRKLPGWCASLVVYRFRTLDTDIARRRALAHQYKKTIVSLHPTVINESIDRATCLRIPVMLSDRDTAIRALGKKGIHVSDVWYDVPISPRKYWYLFLKEHTGVFSKATAEKMLNLPTHMTLTSKDVARIATNFKEKEIVVKEITDMDMWESFVLLRKEANFLQSWHWGDFHEALGNKVYRIGFLRDEMLCGVALLIVENARRGKHILVPAGPLFDWTDEDLVELFFSTVRDIGKREGAVCVRVRPQLTDTNENRTLFKKFHLYSAPMYLHAELTHEISLALPEDELFAHMRKQTRAEIRKGEKQGLRVETTTDASALKEFYRIQLETAERQGFVPFSYKFLHEQFKIFADAGYATLYRAYHDNDLLASAFIIFYGPEAAYHYGASTTEGRKFPGAYLIQWEAMKEAKRRGIPTYNLWGVAKETEKNHRFYPISIFKRGFGGTDHQYLHAHDLVINPLRYALFFCIEWVRSKRRHV